MTKQKGFSLMEVVMVAAIIVILTAIVAVNATSLVKASNESAAATAVKNIGAANTKYMTLYGGGTNYATGLNALASTNPPLLNSGWVNTAINGVNGYQYGYVTSAPMGQPVRSFTAWATPIDPNQGSKSYCLDQTGQTVSMTRLFGVNGIVCPSVNNTTVFAVK